MRTCRKRFRLLAFLLVLLCILASCAEKRSPVDGSERSTGSADAAAASQEQPLQTPDTSVTSQEPQEEPMPLTVLGSRIACVGDSITYGTKATDPATRSYPAVLQRLLGEDFTVGNFGFPGASYVQTPICYKYYPKCAPYNLSLHFEPDTVVICLGTNDINDWAYAGSSSRRRRPRWCGPIGSWNPSR